MNTSSPTNIKPTTPLKLLLMGAPGSRKTTFGLQFPDVHVLDCDQNLSGPILFLMKGIEATKDTKGVPAPLPNLTFTYDTIRTEDNGDMKDISECFDRVSDKLKLFQTDKEYQKRRTVFVDSLSHVNEFIIRKVLAMKSKTSMEINHWQDFASAAYTLIVSRLDQTGKTVICSCHEEKVTEPDSTNIMKKKLVEINPLFSGRVGDCIGAFFTDVWRLEKRAAPGKIELWLQTDRTPKCEHLKNSLGMPPEINITEGFKTIQPYLQGKI